MPLSLISKSTSKTSLFFFSATLFPKGTMRRRDSVQDRGLTFIFGILVFTISIIWLYILWIDANANLTSLTSGYALFAFLFIVAAHALVKALGYFNEWHSLWVTVSAISILGIAFLNPLINAFITYF